MLLSLNVIILIIIFNYLTLSSKHNIINNLIRQLIDITYCYDDIACIDILKIINTIHIST